MPGESENRVENFELGPRAEREASKGPRSKNSHPKNRNISETAAAAALFDATFDQNLILGGGPRYDISLPDASFRR